MYSLCQQKIFNPKTSKHSKDIFKRFLVQTNTLSFDLLKNIDLNIISKHPNLKLPDVSFMKQSNMFTASESIENLLLNKMNHSKGVSFGKILNVVRESKNIEDS